MLSTVLNRFSPLWWNLSPTMNQREFLIFNFYFLGTKETGLSEFFFHSPFFHIYIYIFQDSRIEMGLSWFPSLLNIFLEIGFSWYTIIRVIIGYCGSILLSSYIIMDLTHYRTHLHVRGREYISRVSNKFPYYRWIWVFIVN